MKMRCCVLSLLGLFVCIGSASAGISSFNNSSGGQSWQTAGNWTAGIPAVGDTAVIGMNGANSAVVNSAGAVCYNLYVGLSGYVSGTAGEVDVTGGSLTPSNSINIGYNEPGKVVVSGGVLTSTGGTTFGSGGGSGTLVIDTGGTYTSNGYFYSGTGSKELVQLDGGTLVLNGGMQALNAAGQIDIEGTGLITVPASNPNASTIIANLNNSIALGFVTTSAPGETVQATYNSVTGGTVQLVPEPTTIALLCGGLGMLLRKRK